MYKYGEEISYDFNLLKVEDLEELQPFICGNKKLDEHIRKRVIQEGQIVDEDGLYFVFRDLSNKRIIAVVSLAASGIIFSVSNYMHVLPAIKIDVFAVDKEYQKIHYDKESEMDSENHYYFSDDIMGTVLSHCRKIAEEKALAQYVVLYADKNAYRFYIRNGFSDYSEFMIKEKNQKISENCPMYIQL